MQVNWALLLIKSLLNASFCAFCFNRSVQTASLPEMDAFEKGIAFYRCSKTLSHWAPHQLSFGLKKDIYICFLSCWIHPLSSSMRAHLFLMAAHYWGNLPPLWLLRGKKCPPGCFSYQLSTNRGFLRVLLQDVAVLQLAGPLCNSSEAVTAISLWLHLQSRAESRICQALWLDDAPSEGSSGRGVVLEKRSNGL